MADSNTDHTKPVHVVGPYAVYGRLAAGGMATVHLGRVIDPSLRSRTVAIKRLHPQFSKDPEFVAMFIDEAKLAARIKHANVVETVDILTMGQELLLVMEYIRGECFSKLLRAARRKDRHPSVEVVGAIASGMLHGLHAAHEAKDDAGELLNVVHRDISPQNVMIGVDGVAKVLDFGVAKASARIQITRDGQMKGKLSYMSPEQLQGQPVDRRADVFACGVVLWEALTRKRLFVADEAGEVLAKILKEEVPPPSSIVPELSSELDAVVLRALHKDNTQRYQTAQELALDLERIIDVATPQGVGEWIESVAGEILGKRSRLLADIETSPLEPMNTEASGDFNASAAFLQLQSWAEREAARVIAEEEMTMAEPVPSHDATAGSSEVAEGKTSAEKAAAGAVAPGSATHEGDSSTEEGEDQTAVTIAVEPDLAAVAARRERKTQAPQRAQPPELPEQFRNVGRPKTLSPSVTPVPSEPIAVSGQKDSKGTRWGVLLSVAAAVVGVAGVVLFQVAVPSGFSFSEEKSSMALRPVVRRVKTVAEAREAAKLPPVVEAGSLPEMAVPGASGAGIAAGRLTGNSTESVSEPTNAAKGSASSDKPKSSRKLSSRAKARRRAASKRRRGAKKAIPVVRRPPPSEQKGRTAGSSPTDCNVPYWIDGRGIRRLKVACL